MCAATVFVWQSNIMTSFTRVSQRTFQKEEKKKHQTFIRNELNDLKICFTLSGITIFSCQCNNQRFNDIMFNWWHYWLIVVMTEIFMTYPYKNCLLENNVCMDCAYILPLVTHLALQCYWIQALGNIKHHFWL